MFTKLPDVINGRCEAIGRYYRALAEIDLCGELESQGFLKMVEPQNHSWLPGFKHEFDVPFHIWDVIPIDELHDFSGGLKPPTR